MKKPVFGYAKNKGTDQLCGELVHNQCFSETTLVCAYWGMYGN